MPTVPVQVFDALASLGQLSDPLAWLVIAAFLLGAVVDRYDRDAARRVTVAAWVLFGVFWFSLVHHFAFVQKSIVEGLGSVVAVPASLYVGYLLYRGRDSLFVLSRAVAAMGIVFFPFETIPVLRETLIETVTAQTTALIHLVGYHPEVVDGMTYDGLKIVGKSYPYRSTFVFHPDGQTITYTIKIACTGIGSMAVIGGLISAVNAPVRRKARALAVAIPVIYVLNLFRNVFIAIGFGTQKFQVFPDVVMALFAAKNETMVSYYVADRLIAQSLSVVALVAITWFAVRELPELVTVIEDALYVLTRREYDLRDALGLSPVRTDGDGSDGE